MHTPRISLGLGASCALLSLAILNAGCDTTPTTTATRPAQVRALDLSGHPDPTDQDRIALSRFVGAWDVNGWYDPPNEARREASGLAAGTVEHGHFLMLDTAGIVDQSGDTEESIGSMMLSVEPGLGLMVTSWSNASPHVQRLRGRVEAEGSCFVFDGIRTGRGNDRLRMVLRFETDDRWVAEFTRKTGGSETIAATYTFTRAM